MSRDQFRGITKKVNTMSDPKDDDQYEECCRCSGTGEITCSDCNGVGCEECDNSGDVFCDQCYGEGFVYY